MKHILCLIFIILIVFPVSTALYDVLVYNGNTWNDQIITVDGKNYSFFYLRQNNQTLVKYPGAVRDVIPPNESCSTTWIYKACRSNVRYMKGDIEVPYWVHENALNVTFNVQIYTSTVGLSYVRSIDDTDLYFGETTRVSVNVTNTGEVEATKIKLTEQLPETIQSISAEGCRIEKNNIVWEGTLKKNEKFRCKYIIKPLDDGVVSFSSKLNYTVLDKEQIITDTKSITAKKTSLTLAKSDKVSSSPQQNTTVTINLSAVDFVNIESLNVIYPDELIILDPGQFTMENLNLTWKGNISAGETLKLEFVLKSRLQGDYVLDFDLVYVFNSIKEDRYWETGLSIWADSFDVSFEHRKEFSSLVLNNPTEYKFIDFEIKVGNQTLKLDELLSKRQKTFRLDPLSTEPDVFISYKTEFGQMQTYTRESNESPVMVRDLSQTPEDTTPAVTSAAQASENTITKENLLDNIDLKIPLIIFSSVIGAVIFFIMSARKGDDLDSEIKELMKK